MSRRYWYLYNGTGDDNQPGSYVSPTPTALLCSGGTITCSIYVPAGSTFPTPTAITPNIKAYLATAKAFSYASYPLTGTPYVSSRP